MTAATFKIHRKIYSPAGYCIYCGSLDAKSEEHIIPTSFGGGLVLPDASCAPCRDITSGFETECLNGMFFTARAHLGIHGRRKLKPDRLPLWLVNGTQTETVSIPKEEHPSAIIMPSMPYPDVMAGLPLTNEDIPPAVHIGVIPVTPNFAERVKKIKGNINLVKGKGFGALAFYRLIAKIGHAFTVAELGIDAFSPALLGLIKGTPPLFASHFVGSGLVDEPRSEYLHEVSFSNDVVHAGWTLIVVKVRLFACFGTRHHYAVTGIRRDQKQSR